MFRRIIKHLFYNFQNISFHIVFYKYTLVFCGRIMDLEAGFCYCIILGQSKCPEGNKKSTALRCWIFMAGVAGLEPTHGGFRIHCLTNLAIPQYFAVNRIYYRLELILCQGLFKNFSIFHLSCSTSNLLSLHFTQRKRSGCFTSAPALR